MGNFLLSVTIFCPNISSLSYRCICLRLQVSTEITSKGNKEFLVLYFPRRSIKLTFMPKGSDDGLYSGLLGPLSNIKLIYF